MMLGSAWLEKYGVRFDWRADGFHLDENRWEHQRFNITLEREDVEHEFTWRAGMGITDDPDADTILPHLADECAMAHEYGQDFPEFARTYGYDEDSLRAYRTWEAVKKQRDDLYEFMTSEAMWEDFLAIREADADEE